MPLLPSEVTASLDYYETVELPVMQAIVDSLDVGPGHQVLDAGCGAGAMSLVFAAAGASVVAIDIDEQSLHTAQERLNTLALAAKISVQRADILALPFDDSQFNLAWCSLALHHIADKLSAVNALARVIAPGGRLVIREGGLPMRFLPFDIGDERPGLQDRLREADARWFAMMLKDTLPDEVPFPYGWSHLLRLCGFTDVHARTFAIDAVMPFSDAHQELLLNTLHRVLKRDEGEYGPFLTTEDRTTVRQLVDPDGPRYILKRDDLHLCAGISIYVGTKA